MALPVEIPREFYLLNVDHSLRYHFYIAQAADNTCSINAGESTFIKTTGVANRLMREIPGGQWVHVRLFTQIDVKDQQGKITNLTPGDYLSIKDDFGVLYECGRSPIPMGDKLVVHLNCNLI